MHDNTPRDPLNPKKPLAWDPESPPKFQIFEFKVSGAKYEAGVVRPFQSDLLIPKKPPTSPDTLPGSSQREIAKLEIERELLLRIRKRLRARQTDHEQEVERLEAEIIAKRQELAALAAIAAQSRRPPGAWCFALVDFFCGPKTLERIVQPIIAEYQEEYFTARAQGRTWKARWVRIRGPLTLCKALGVFTLLEGAWKILKILGILSLFHWIKDIIGLAK